MYLDLFSQHLFGQAEYFPGAEKYTLQPLIDNGVDALACADIDGLEDVKQKKQIRRSAKKHQDKNVCSIKCERGQGRIKVDKFKEM